MRELPLKLHLLFCFNCPKLTGQILKDKYLVYFSQTRGKKNQPCKYGMRKKRLEDIKKRWQEYTEELYKKDLHDPDNHDGVMAHLEPDILKCEVKWA